MTELQQKSRRIRAEACRAYRAAKRGLKARELREESNQEVRDALKRAGWITDQRAGGCNG